MSTCPWPLFPLLATSLLLRTSQDWFNAFLSLLRALLRRGSSISKTLCLIRLLAWNLVEGSFFDFWNQACATFPGFVSLIRLKAHASQTPASFFFFFRGINQFTLIISP